MNNKNFLGMLIVTIMLSACGGGSSSNNKPGSSTQTQNNNTNNTAARWLEIDLVTIPTEASGRVRYIRRYDDKLYLFMASSDPTDDNFSNYHVVKSSDDGKSWSNPESIRLPIGGIDRYSYRDTFNHQHQQFIVAYEINSELNAVVYDADSGWGSITNLGQTTASTWAFLGSDLIGRDTIDWDIARSDRKNLDKTSRVAVGQDVRPTSSTLLSSNIIYTSNVRDMEKAFVWDGVNWHTHDMSGAFVMSDSEADYTNGPSRPVSTIGEDILGYQGITTEDMQHIFYQANRWDNRRLMHVATARNDVTVAHAKSCLIGADVSCVLNAYFDTRYKQGNSFFHAIPLDNNQLELIVAQSSSQFHVFRFDPSNGWSLDHSVARSPGGHLVPLFLTLDDGSMVGINATGPSPNIMWRSVNGVWTISDPVHLPVSSSTNVSTITYHEAFLDDESNAHFLFTDGVEVTKLIDLMVKMDGSHTIIEASLGLPSTYSSLNSYDTGFYPLYWTVQKIENEWHHIWGYRYRDDTAYLVDCVYMSQDEDWVCSQVDSAKTDVAYRSVHIMGDYLVYDKNHTSYVAQYEKTDESSRGNWGEGKATLSPIIPKGVINGQLVSTYRSPGQEDAIQVLVGEGAPDFGYEPPEIDETPVVTPGIGSNGDIDALNYATSDVTIRCPTSSHTKPIPGGPCRSQNQVYAEVFFCNAKSRMRSACTSMYSCLVDNSTGGFKDRYQMYLDTCDEYY